MPAEPVRDFNLSPRQMQTSQGLGSGAITSPVVGAVDVETQDPHALEGNEDLCGVDGFRQVAARQLLEPAQPVADRVAVQM